MCDHDRCSDDPGERVVHTSGGDTYCTSCWAKAGPTVEVSR